MDITKSYHKTTLQAALADPGGNLLQLAITTTVVAYGAIIVAQAQRAASRLETVVLPSPKTAIERFAFELLSADLSAAGIAIKPGRRQCIRRGNRVPR